MPTRSYATRLPVSVEQAFAWHDRPGALERLSPPFLPAGVERSDRSLAVGSEVVLRMGPTPLAPRWRARHIAYDPPHEFRDVQESGPFAAWDHRHRFEADGPDASVLTDEVHYRLPLGPLGDLVAGRFVGATIDRMFAYRHRRTVADLAAHAAARQRGVRPMRIAITGSTGMIGEALTAFLTTGGHDVVRIVRSAGGDDTIHWDPDGGRIEAERLRGVDAVVHLAGEPIAAGRGAAHLERVRTSRERGTRLLAEALADLGQDGPSVLVSSSATGYYGDRGEEVLTEDAGPGDDVLAEICVAWEQATAAAEEAGLRVVHVRTGVVQTPAAGALAKLLPLFRLGLGGRLGSGRQYEAWVSLEDVVGIFHHALTTPELSGAVNATAPEAVTNATYTATLARVLGRPALLPVPKVGPKLLLGELAEPMLYASQRVTPAVALASGYRFVHPNLEGCLRDMLGRPAA